MTYHPSLTDFVSLPHIVCYYRLMFPPTLSLKYVIERICFSVIVSTKYIIVSLLSMS